MRENIGLFRGKRIDNGEWVEGDLKQHKDLFGKVKCMYIEESEYDLGLGIAYTHDRFEVLPETVGEFTGLSDKDDKKIFEGDIIQHTDVYSSIVHVIKFYNGKFIAANRTRPIEHKWMSDNGCDYDLNFTITLNSWLIIGNIHDNPELMEVKE